MKDNWQKRAIFGITISRAMYTLLCCLLGRCKTSHKKKTNGKVKEKFFKMAGWNLSTLNTSIYFNKPRSHEVNVEDRK